ncbi:hypothetical protein [Kiloniella sp. b19]|uniref:hypothetical protein n=1 Tax=Kiloniella sp. GXU_MW_B19 TaxID=3141326 RepID=UPI0031D10BF6
MGELVIDQSKKRKTLVMWSGGLDSTYGVVRLLNETDDEVYAHHMHRVARHDRGDRSSMTCESEAIAIEKMKPFIQEYYRDFHFSESLVDLSDFSAFARDTTTTMFFAAQVAKSFGFTVRDRILFSMNSDEDRDWNPGSEIYSFLRMMNVGLLKNIWRSEDVPYCFLWPEPPSKQEEADYMPYELFCLTSSCRDPLLSPDGHEVKCGRCAECITLRSVRHRELLEKPEASVSSSLIGQGIKEEQANG